MEEDAARVASSPRTPVDLPEPRETEEGTDKYPPKKQPKKEGRKRHGARNQHRHRDFAKWLQANFPDSFRQSSCQRTVVNPHNSEDAPSPPPQKMHILDVAGGKGELSARLSMCLLQNVVMIDPRPANVVHCFESLVLPKIPKKWQKRLEDQRAENPKFVQEKLKERFRQLILCFDERTLEHNADIQEAVQNASLLIGLHSDGATEAIVDAALAYQKPFVVVPCCVFPNLFPQRTVVMKEGADRIPVRTHEQFCQFLLDKHPDFKLEILPFEGRNTAICWNGITSIPS